MRERVIVVSFSVCLSVCQNNIWELTPLELRTKREKNILYWFLNVPIFDKRCCLGEKVSQTWPIEIDYTRDTAPKSSRAKQVTCWQCMRT